MVFFVDITDEKKPFGVSNFTVPESRAASFCARGGRFGAHSSNENLHADVRQARRVLLLVQRRRARGRHPRSVQPEGDRLLHPGDHRQDRQALREDRRGRALQGRDPDQQRRGRRPRLYLHRRPRQHRHAHPRATEDRTDGTGTEGQDRARHRREHRHRPRHRQRAGEAEGVRSRWSRAAGTAGRAGEGDQAKLAIIERDLMQDGAPQKIAQAALAGLGTVDILVNNAGGSRSSPRTTEAQWHEALTLNFTRQRQLTHHCCADDRAQLGAHHQHHRQVRARGHQRRVRRQGGDALLGEGPVARSRQARHHGELDPARAHHQRADPAQLHARVSAAEQSSTRSRWASTASPRTSPTWPASSPRRARATSPAP